MLISILLGSLYGLIVGIIPAVGATVGLTLLFGFVTLLQIDPYLSLAFITAAVASSTTADSYSSILIGVPGANSSAASVLDGYSMTKNGEGVRAITAAVVTSTFSGILVGLLTFTFLPYFSIIIQYTTSLVIWCVLLLSLTCIAFLSSKCWWKNVLAIGMAFIAGYIGIDPYTNADRWTMGWDYLADGIQLLPVVIGLFGIPECVDLYKTRKRTTHDNSSISAGVWDVIHNWKDALRGSFVGSIIGLIPGVGGAVSDWLSYSLTRASHRTETFGSGNVKGVIGIEGSNNAQKATSLIPTLLFGIPGASFAAIYLALLTFIGFEVGTEWLLQDTQFTNTILISFIISTAVVGCLSFVILTPIKYMLSIDQRYVAAIVFVICVFAAGTYTGGIEDYIILGIFSVIGFLMKKYEISRPAFLIAFILFPKVELYTIIVSSLYLS